jgi:hypothetical protein
MQQHPRVLGVVPITHYPTMVFSSESAMEGTPNPGDYALLHPQRYQVTAQNSQQLVGKPPSQNPGSRCPSNQGSCSSACGRMIRWALPCKWITS